MAAEKVVGNKASKKTAISPDSVPKRLAERSLFVTASKAPDEVQPKPRAGFIRKAIATSLMSLSLTSAAPQFAYAGGQDEKGKNVITKNELVSPDPTNAPISSVGVYPIVGSTLFIFGTGPQDVNKIDATSQLSRIGVTSFTPGSFGLEGRGALFYILVPGSTGIISFEPLTYQEVSGTNKAELTSNLVVTDFKRVYSAENVSYIRFNNNYIALHAGRTINVLGQKSKISGADIDADLTSVGIPPTSKLGKDYTIEITYDDKDKLVYFDFKIGSKYVLSYQIDPYDFNKPVFKVSTPPEEPTSSMNSH
ncbi:MAG: hypothetical protein M1530_03115 [Candidatus Marsarchaeota archaeon]|nr:hypothetical protein [Candidatus Marsarchaeota archaeon]